MRGEILAWIAGVSLLGITACLEADFPGWDRDADGYDERGDPADCAPDDPEVHPNAPDPFGDGLDQDCDTCDEVSGDGVDRDCDGFPGNAELAGDPLFDCDDTDAAIHPAATEACDGIDNDCDPKTDEWLDSDGDGLTPCEGDCDDGRARVGYHMTEICDGIDNDCDGETDEPCRECNRHVPSDHDSLGDAIEASTSGEWICVEPGVYGGPFELGDHEVHLLGIGGPSVTVLQGDGATTVVTQPAGGAPFSLIGFEVSGGQADEGYGGGLSLKGVGATLSHLTIRDNMAPSKGGGLYLANGSFVLSDVLVAENTCSNPGGGMAVADAESVTLENVRFSGNYSEHHNAGLYIEDTVMTARNVLIDGNHDPNGVPVLALLSSRLTLENATIHRNAGCGMYLTSDSVGVLTNVIIAENTGGVASEAGGIAVAPDNSSVQLSHCCVWGNTPTDFVGFDDPIGMDGNLAEDPSFVDVSAVSTLDFDHHLATDSPLLDQGDPAGEDPDGSRSDMGAFAGLGAASWDLDGDGDPVWWQPGSYDESLLPAHGWDCDDQDVRIHAEVGCEDPR